MGTNEEKLRDACYNAATAFGKISDPAYDEIMSKLEYCIGSYDFDKNPVGLYEAGEEALPALNDAKKKYPRKFNKKVITDLEKGVNTK